MLTDDEKDRALCEAHCNSAADEYFNSRPQIDSQVNRRIFYAGHRKAWLQQAEATAPLLARIAELEKALSGMLAICNDSQGVAGYHLNGNTADWDEFPEVAAAESALSAAPAAQPTQKPMTKEQIIEGRRTLPYDVEDLPDPWSFVEGVRYAEDYYGIKEQP